MIVNFSIHPKYSDTITVNICQGESYLFGGTVRTTSGFYAQNFTSTFGCDSIKNLQLIVHPKFADTVTVDICQGESVVFGGVTRTTSGFYTQNFTSTFGCDSIKNLQLIVHPKFADTVTVDVCQGESFLFGGIARTTAGFYSQNLSTTFGCDSIKNLQLIVHPKFADTVTVDICQGESYLFGGVARTTSGFYAQNLTSTFGCDSIKNLQLIVHPKFADTVTVDICQGESYLFGGITRTTSGFYTQNLTTTFGCDSIKNLQLIVHPKFADTVTVDICQGESYLFGGTVRTTSGFYTQNLTSTFGCDSIKNLHLIVHPKFADTVTVDICQGESYLFGGVARTTSGFYTQNLTTTFGCDSIKNLHLIVHPKFADTVTVDICQGESYLFGGITRTTAGFYSQNLSTTFGCDSIKNLQLIVHPKFADTVTVDICQGESYIFGGVARTTSGFYAQNFTTTFGCDSIKNLHLIVHPKFHDTITVDICQGESYLFGGITRTTSGFYTQNLTSTFGCDSIKNLKLIVHPKFADTVTVNICQGESFVFGGVSRTTSGFYTQNFTTTFGCDSIKNLQLIVHPKFADTVTVDICQGESVVFGGVSRTTSGFYTQNLSTTFGCDSIKNLQLIVHPKFADTVTVDICQGESYLFGGIARTTSGFYTQNFTTTFGCDSIKNLNLIVHPKFADTVTVDVCQGESFLFGGIARTTSGFYTQNFTSTFGCDSIKNLQLIVHPKFADTVTVDICQGESYLFGGVARTSSGFYTQNFTSTFGCDSIINLQLIVHPKFHDTITVDICQGESYLFGGITRTTAGFYSQNLSTTFGCDSIKNLQLIVHPKFADTLTVDICQGESYLFGGVARMTSGFYAQNFTTTFGCDSIKNLQLIVHPKFADTVTVDICQGESYLFGGVARTTSGFYTQNLTTTFGCDSIKNLQLIVHSKFADTVTVDICQGESYLFGGVARTTSGFYTQNLTTTFGCDSIKNLRLIVHPKFADTVTVDICQGESYLFGGVARTTSGFYTQNLTTTFGCDSIKNLKLIVHPKLADTVTVDICQGESYLFGGTVRTTSGFYTQNLTTTFGCDSIKNLHLIVHPKFADTVTVDICQGESYLFGGTVRTTSGFYTQNFTSTFGCDSIKNLQLIVHPKFADTLTVDICQGESYLFGGITRTTAGFYSQNLSTTFGCDSIKNLQLIVHPKFTDTITVDICQGESFVFGGVARTTSGFYTQNLTTTFGCDSIKNLHLIVHPKYSDTVTVNICQDESVVFGGVPRTTSGFYTQNLTTTFGCDSITNLQLIVHPKFADTLTVDICQGESVVFGGVARTTSGFYTQNFTSTFGCDSIKNLQLIVHPKFADTVTVDICQGESYLFGGVARTTSGFYTQNFTTTFGCDSIKNLHLIVHPKFHDTITANICQGGSYFFGGIARTTSGFYSQNLSTTFGCDSIKNLHLIVHQKYSDTVTVDICQGESYLFGGTARTSSGFYTQNLTTTFGCDSIKNLHLIVHPKFESTITITLCDGEMYLFQGNPIVQNQLLTQTLTSATGCDSIINYQIIFEPLPQANFTYILAEISDFSQLVTLSSTNQNLSSYSWSVDGEIVGNQANQSYYWDVFSDSIIVVNLSVTNQLGCSFQHEENIFFSPPVLLYAPNAFTPDGGGFNTTYQPIFNRPDLVDEYFFQIINRWGEVIFSTSDLNESWDGTFKGLVVQDGVYSWKIEYEASGKKHQLLGHVTVLR
ncbi:MAG: gliding motility-associated C-terminal domain-containing protein [Fluviicola sp.]|nr:gliding motility-associated C-terminal domain-containing protein [Fluviicola sp.]